MSLSRRQLLTLAGFGGAGLALSGCSGGLLGPQTGSTGAVLTSAVPLPRPFTMPCPVPPTARAEAGDPTAYRLVARRAQAEILPGRRTEVLGYDGVFPGPTIRALSGRPVSVTLRNELGVDTVLHLHGGRTPPEHDGYPTDMVGSGTERRYEYPLGQRAAPLWYHDHAMDFTGPNVYAGLAGMFLLTDDEEEALGLPRDERDIPLVICDRAFDEDARMAYPLRHPDRSRPGVQDRFHGGVLGDCVLVNGAPWPVLEVDAARYRFRVLNASNARRYRLSLDQGAELVQVGADLGLLQRPIPRRAVTLAGAERADLCVDFTGYAVGTRITMRNELGEGGAAQVMQFLVARRAADDSRVPQRLATIEPVDPSRVAVSRDLHFALGTAVEPERSSGLGTGNTGHAGQGSPVPLWSVDGVTFASGQDVARPVLGTVERWRLSSDVHHPVHAHLLGFQVADDAGRPCWKDTVDLPPAGAVEVLVPIEGYRGRYVLHCHNLEHEDMMMMVDFTVV